MKLLEGIIFAERNESILKSLLFVKTGIMKKIIAFAACILLFGGSAFSQDYTHAIGVRVGGSSGSITYKQHLQTNNAIEAMLWLDWRSGFSVAGLYEWTTPVINNDFNLYYGVGAHLGVSDKDFALGIDAIVGLEYKIPNAPIALSLDYKPYINIIPTPNSYGLWDLAIGIKFTF